MFMSHIVHSMNIGVYLGQLDLSLNHSGLFNLHMNKPHTVLSSVWECHQRGITALAASQTVSEIGNEWG